MIRALRLPVTAEALLVTTIFVVTAFLVRTAPARSIVETPLSTTVTAGPSFRLHVEIDSTRVGTTTMTFITERNSGAIAALGGIDVALQAPNTSIPPEALQLDHKGPGIFVASSVSILDPGRWTINVVLHADLFTDVNATPVPFSASP